MALSAFMVPISFLVFFFILTIRSRQAIKKKASSLLDEISKNRKIIFEGISAIKSRTGYLVLTEKTLEFYYLKTKKSNNFYILLNDITSIDVSGDWFFGKNLIVKTLGDEISFSCNNAQVWKNQIENLI